MKKNKKGQIHKQPTPYSGRCHMVSFTLHEYEGGDTRQSTPHRLGRNYREERDLEGCTCHIKERATTNMFAEAAYPTAT